MGESGGEIMRREGREREEGKSVKMLKEEKEKLGEKFIHESIIIVLRPLTYDFFKDVT